MTEILTPSEMYDPAKGWAAFNQGRTDRGNALAGQAIAAGNWTGGMNALAQSGNLQGAMQIKQFQTQQDEAARERQIQSFKMLGGLVRSANTPEQFEAAKAAARRVYGSAVDNYQFGDLPALKSQFADADRQFALEERKVAAQENAVKQRYLGAGGAVLDTQSNTWLTPPAVPGKFQDRVVTIKDPNTGYDTTAILDQNGNLRRIDPNALPSATPSTAPAGATDGSVPLPKALREKMLAQDAKALDEYRSAAADAQNARATLDELEAQRARTGGITGTWWSNSLGRGLARTVGGGYLGVPTSEQVGAWDAMAAPAANLQLGFTSKTKGAISDREMAMFGAATPGQYTTDIAAKPMIAAQRAALQRTEERAIFYENWLSTHGSSRGWQEAWTKFTNENPVVQVDKSGNIIGANTANIGNWRPYLTMGKAAPRADAAANQTQAPQAPAANAPKGRIIPLAPSAEEKARIIAEARDAVQKGADVNAVRKRLKMLGVEF